MTEPTKGDFEFLKEGGDPVYYWDDATDDEVVVESTDFVLVEEDYRVDNFDADYGTADRVTTLVIQHKDGGPFYMAVSTYRSWDGSDWQFIGEVKQVEVVKKEWVKIDYPG